MSRGVVVTERQHRSVSSLRLLQRCGKAWEFKYVDGIASASGSAAIRGSAFHSGVAHNLRQKIKTRRDLPTSEVLDATAQAVDEAFAGPVYFTQEETAVGPANIRARTKNVAVAMAKFHHLRVAPFLHPLAVEEEIRISPAPEVLGVDVLGRPDLITREDFVVDHKSKEARPRPGEEHYEQGLTMYALLFHARYGRLPEAVALDYTGRRKNGELFYERRASKRTIEDLRGMVVKLQAAEATIKAGAFLPADPSSWWCSEKWCSYWNACPFGGERVR